MSRSHIDDLEMTVATIVAVCRHLCFVGSAEVVM